MRMQAFALLSPYAFVFIVHCSLLIISLFPGALQFDELHFIERHDSDVCCIAEVRAFGKNAIGAVDEGGCKAHRFGFGQLMVRAGGGSEKFRSLQRHIGIDFAQADVRRLLEKFAVLARQDTIIGAVRLAAYFKQSHRRQQNLDIAVVDIVQDARHHRIVIRMHLQQPNQRSRIQEKNAAMFQGISHLSRKFPCRRNLHAFPREPS